MRWFLPVYRHSLWRVWAEVCVADADCGSEGWGAAQEDTPVRGRAVALVAVVAGAPAFGCDGKSRRVGEHTDYTREVTFLIEIGSN